jgi:tRNA threonylcarbamoyladenosine biosynthesis protein TsaB
MILAIDTSTQWTGLALASEGQIWYEKIWRTSRRHTVELAPAIRQALNETGVQTSALTAVAAALGPGSFTSLRIGLAMAKGLCLSLKIPLIGIPSLDITAQGQPPMGLPMICVLKSGRERFAACEYRCADGRWQAVSGIENAGIEDLTKRIIAPTIIRGEIDAHERRMFKRRWRNALVAEPAENLRRPSLLAQMALRRLEEGSGDSAATLAPIYIHTINHPTV